MHKTVSTLLYGMIFLTIMGEVLTADVHAQASPGTGNDRYRILEELDVDSVTSDFPVSFSMVNSGEWQFIAYYDKARRLTVASRKRSEKKWIYAYLPTKVGWDAHNSIVMALDPVGCLHVSGNMHADRMLYFKTSRPHDISTFAQVFPLVSSDDELRCTYPRFMKDPRGKLIYMYRSGGSGNGNTIINSYDEKTQKFSRLSDKPLFDGLGQMSAYMEGPVAGPDGYYHLSWLWRNTPDCETNHDLSYARSKDLVHWGSIGNAQSPLPITPNSQVFTVDPVAPGGGALNGITRLFFGRKNQPLIAFMKYDSKGRSQLYIARSAANGWKISQASNWDHRWAFSGHGSIEPEIKINSARVSADGHIRIGYWHVKKGDGELVIDGKSFEMLEDKAMTMVDLLEYPVSLVRPMSTTPGMSVKWLKTLSAGNPDEFYALRWETLGIRRYYDKPLNDVPPSAMKLYRIRKM